MAIDSSQVGDWIHWAKEMAIYEGWYEDEPTQSLQVWRVLKYERDSGDTDSALACAEHYMFAFTAVAHGVPYAIMVFLAGTYQSAKAIAWLADHSGGAIVRKLTGKSPSSLMKLGGGHLSAPSVDQLDWGEKGAADGRKVSSKGRTYYGVV